MFLAFCPPPIPPSMPVCMPTPDKISPNLAERICLKHVERAKMVCGWPIKARYARGSDTIRASWRVSGLLRSSRSSALPPGRAGRTARSDDDGGGQRDCTQNPTWNVEVNQVQEPEETQKNDQCNRVVAVACPNAPNIFSLQAKRNSSPSIARKSHSSRGCRRERRFYV